MSEHAYRFLSVPGESHPTTFLNHPFFQVYVAGKIKMMVMYVEIRSK